MTFIGILHKKGINFIGKKTEEFLQGFKSKTLDQRGLVQLGEYDTWVMVDLLYYFWFLWIKKM